MAVRSENRNLLVGMVTGILAGGLAAVLLAPSKGEETRKRLGRTADETKERAGGLAARGREYVRSKRSQWQEALEAGRIAAEEKRAELEAQLKEQAHEAAKRTT